MCETNHTGALCAPQPARKQCRHYSAAKKTNVTLAVIRPSPIIAPNIEPILIALLDAGYVSCDPDGWITTAQGCKVVEGKSLTSADSARICGVTQISQRDENPPASGALRALSVSVTVRCELSACK